MLSQRWRQTPAAELSSAKRASSGAPSTMGPGRGRRSLLLLAGVLCAGTEASTTTSTTTLMRVKGGVRKKSSPLAADESLPQRAAKTRRLGKEEEEEEEKSGLKWTDIDWNVLLAPGPRVKDDFLKTQQVDKGDKGQDEGEANPPSLFPSSSPSVRPPVTEPPTDAPTSSPSFSPSFGPASDPVTSAPSPPPKTSLELLPFSVELSEEVQEILVRSALTYLMQREMLVRGEVELQPTAETTATIKSYTGNVVFGDDEVISVEDLQSEQQEILFDTDAVEKSVRNYSGNQDLEVIRVVIDGVSSDPKDVSSGISTREDDDNASSSKELKTTTAVMVGLVATAVAAFVAGGVLYARYRFKYR